MAGNVEKLQFIESNVENQTSKAENEDGKKIDCSQ